VNFEEVLGTVKRRVAHHVYRYSNRVSVDDAYQAALLKLWVNWETITQQGEHQLAWVSRAVEWAVIDAVRAELVHSPAFSFDDLGYWPAGEGCQPDAALQAKQELQAWAPLMQQISCGSPEQAAKTQA